MSSNPFNALGNETDSDDEDNEKVEKLPNKPSKEAAKKPPVTKSEPVLKSEADMKERQNKEQKDKKALPAQKKFLEKHPAPLPKLPVAAGGPKPEAQSSAADDKAKRGKREFERKSGTGRGKEVSKGGAGGNNWGKDAGTDVVADVDAAAAEAGGDAEAKDEAEAPAPEEPEGMTLEEYETLKASKRQGKAFQELAPRKLAASDIKGKAYKKDEKPEEVLIKIGETADEEDKAERKNKESRAGLQRVDFAVLPSQLKKESAVDGAPSSFGGPRRGGDRGFRGGARGAGGDRGFRGGAPREGGAPRGGGDRPFRGGASRGGAPGGNRGGPNLTNDHDFPKL